MADNASSSGYRTYIFPNNVVSGGRFFGFGLRNVIEGVILALFMLSIAMSIPVTGMSMRITLVCILCLPAAILGLIGIGGDPVSTYFSNMLSWQKTKGIILYNGSMRFYEETPVDAMMKQPDIRDKVVTMLEERRQKKMAKDRQEVMVEGVTFEFAQDKDEAGILARKAPKEGSAITEESLSLSEEDFEDMPFEDPEVEDDAENMVVVPFSSLGIDAEERDFLSDTPIKSEAVPTIKARGMFTNIGEEALF